VDRSGSESCPVSSFDVVVLNLQVLLPQYYVGILTLCTVFPVCRFIVCSSPQTFVGSIQMSATSITYSTGIMKRIYQYNDVQSPEEGSKTNS
jgi:hypothetical protein